MAVFGPQLIYTVIMFVLLTKLGKFYSFGRFILCNKLFRYLSPSSEDLKKAVRNHYKSATQKNKKLNKVFEIDDDKEEFNIPEGATIELSCSKVSPHDLYYIKYTDEFQSFVDISLIALIIYITTEIYYSLFQPGDEVNLSVVWCTMALIYGMSCLGSIAVNYLRTEEASLLYVFTCLSFVLSLIVQLADTKYFDFNLKDAFRNVSTNTLNLIQAHINLNSNLAESKPQQASTPSSSRLYSQLQRFSTNELMFTCFIALISGLIGGLLFFPGFRLARLHFLCLKFNSDSKLKKLIYYINFILPLVVSFCWIKINTSRLAPKSKPSIPSFVSFNQLNDTAQQFLALVAPNDKTARSLNSYKIVYDVFIKSNMKIYLIIFIFLLRLSLFRDYAQSYLNLAFELATSLRKRSTRITNLKYISTVSSIYQYYGVVASQYVVPLFIILFLVLLLKTLGDYTWCGNIESCNQLVNMVSNYTSSFRIHSAQSTSTSVLKSFESSNFNMTLSHNALNKIFSPLVLRSLLGYFTFWTTTIWFTISSFGLIYYNYIDRQI